MNPRRRFFQDFLGLGAGAAALSRASKAQQVHPTEPAAKQKPDSGAALPVLTPDIPDLPFIIDNGVKVFHLIAEPVKQMIIPGRALDLWGFNGSAPGPTIQANEGDRLRTVFENHLPEPTGIHWHGLELPIEMDGVPGIGQKPVMPGERFVYEFSLHQNGTFFYHSHMAMQEMVGMLGGFIIHPKTAYSPRADKDYLIALQEYAVLPNSTIPNSMNMEFNWLTFNGKAGPASTPLIVRHGERVRIRIVNLGMDHHPIHLHGFTFWETGHEGARQPEAIWPRGNTTLVGVAQARDIEFVADRLGDWMLHCHLPHHMMNQMASNVGPMTRLGMPGMDHGNMSMPELPKNANQVPLFPQDAFMEGTMMAMDKEVDKPETYGLPAGWSGFVGGMMTLVRVLPPDQYEKIMDLKAKQQAQQSQEKNAR
jgi:FtsP/CotA-like multicopper oxidase with cupredoxin domain